MGHAGLITLRIVHIVLGVYWAGTIFFFVTYLEPATRAAGPEGGKVMLQLFARRYLTVLPIVAAVTILAGLWLMWTVSAGFSPTWMRSRLGRTMSFGAACALIAFFIGMGVMRPSAVRIWAIMRALPQIADESTRATRLAEAQVFRVRAALSARIVGVFLLLAVASMAMARYL
jgi:uncharacterized membrane protein